MFKHTAWDSIKLQMWYLNVHPYRIGAYLVGTYVVNESNIYSLHSIICHPTLPVYIGWQAQDITTSDRSATRTRPSTIRKQVRLMNVWLDVTSQRKDKPRWSPRNSGSLGECHENLCGLESHKPQSQRHLSLWKSSSLSNTWITKHVICLFA